MRRRTLLIALGAAVLLGVVGGALAATGGGASNGASATTSTVVVLPGATRPPSLRLRARQVRPGSLRVVDRTADPNGGPDWAVRTFVARELWNGKPKGGWIRCGELGRVVGDAFGWIVPGSNRLQPVALDDGWLLQCEPEPIRSVSVGGGRDGRMHRTVRVTPARRQPLGSWLFATLVAHPLGPTAHFAGSVAWALVPSTLRGVSAWIDPARTQANHARDGVVIAFGPSSAQKWDVAMRASRGGGAPTVHHPLDNGFGTSRADVRDMRVIARAGDPAGGLALGITGRTLGNGRPCLSTPSSLVDDRVGQVVPAVGLFLGDATCQALIPPTAKDPFSFGQSAQNGADEDELPDAVVVQRARAAARRTKPGQQTVMYGRVLPGIVRVQISTPSDVRTLIPGPNHAVLAVWDILFKDGARATLTGTYANGKTVVRHLRLAGFP